MTVLSLIANAGIPNWYIVQCTNLTPTLQGNNNWTGINTFYNYTIVNFNTFNITGLLCDNTACYSLSELNTSGSGNTSFNQSLTDELYIKVDGTSTTTAEIPFARGIKISSNPDGAIGSLVFENSLYTYLEEDKAKISYDSGTDGITILGVNSKDYVAPGGAINILTGNGFNGTPSGVLGIRTGNGGGTNGSSAGIFIITGDKHEDGVRGNIHIRAGDFFTPSNIYIDAGVNGKVEITGNVTAQNLCYSNGSNCPVASVVTYVPTNVATAGGSNTTSNISLLAEYDLKTYNISEGSGANPLTFYMNYTGVTSFTQWVIREYYLGSSGHNIQFEIYDYETSAWEEYYTIVGQSGFNIISLPCYDSDEHISGGIVQTRLIHIENGISSHRLYIDFSWLQTTSTIASSIDLTGYAKYNYSFNNFYGSGNFNTSGNINATNITASYFIGNGSLLTGINETIDARGATNKWIANYTNAIINNLSITGFALFNKTPTGKNYTNSTLVINPQTNLITANNMLWVGARNVSYMEINSEATTFYGIISPTLIDGYGINTYTVQAYGNVLANGFVITPGGLFTNDIKSYDESSVIDVIGFEDANVRLAVHGSVSISEGSSWENHGVCYLADGILGHCTSMDADGKCTCEANV